MVYQRLKIFLSRSSYWVYPSRCVLCLGSGMPNIDLCEPCLQQLAIIDRACVACGVSLPVVTVNSLCGNCIKRPSAVDASFALCAYQEPLSWLIHALKYQAQLANARVFAALWLKQFSSNLKPMPEMIIPVPLHVDRLKERGFNQALEFARPIAKALEIPLSYRHCVRVINTVQQTELPAQRRAANVRHAFAIKAPLKVRRVALCDDVVTTGATVNELARLLKDHGVEHVQVWSIAKTAQLL